MRSVSPALAVAAVLALGGGCKKDPPPISEMYPPASSEPASAGTLGSTVTLKDRTLVYESEEALDDAHRFARQSDKEAFALVVSTRGTHLEAGTRVKVIGRSGMWRRQIEVEGTGARWWVEPDYLSR